MKKQIIFLSALAVCTVSNAMMRQSVSRVLRPSGLSGTAALVMGKRTLIRSMTTKIMPYEKHDFKKLLELSKQYKKLDTRIRNLEQHEKNLRVDELELLQNKRQEILDAYAKTAVTLTRSHGVDNIMKPVMALMDENPLLAALAQSTVERELEDAIIIENR